MPHVGQEMLTLFGSPDFIPCGEFMISLFHYTVYIHYRIGQSWNYVYGLMTLVCLPGLVLTILSRTYFIRKTREFMYINVQTMKPSTCITLHELNINVQFIAWVGIIYYQMTIKNGWVSDFVKCLNQFGLIRILFNFSCGLGQIMLIRYDFIFE